jgi:hypothetical protein
MTVLWGAHTRAERECTCVLGLHAGVGDGFAAVVWTRRQLQRISVVSRSWYCVRGFNLSAWRMPAWYGWHSLHGLSM